MYLRGQVWNNFYWIKVIKCIVFSILFYSEFIAPDWLRVIQRFFQHFWLTYLFWRLSTNHTLVSNTTNDQ